MVAWRSFILFLFVAGGAAFRAPNAVALSCDLELTTVYAGETSASRTFRVFELRMLPPATEFRGLENFQAWVAGQVNPDPIFLLRRQRALYAQHFPTVLGIFDAIIQRQVGEIEPIDCLASMLLAKHFEFRGGYRVPTEFLARMLVKGDKVRVFFVSNGEAMVNTTAAEEARFATALANGWSYKMSLHNHPFVFDNPTGDIAGTLIPSGDRESADIGTYLRERARHGLKGSAITNGFHTIYFRAEEFDTLADSNDGRP